MGSVYMVISQAKYSEGKLENKGISFNNVAGLLQVPPGY